MRRAQPTWTRRARHEWVSLCSGRSEQEKVSGCAHRGLVDLDGKTALGSRVCSRICHGGSPRAYRSIVALEPVATELLAMVPQQPDLRMQAVLSSKEGDAQ